METFFKIFNSIHVALYLLSNGRFGGKQRGVDILILFTKGRKTGINRSKPLMYVRDGENYAVAASFMGSDKHPSWYWNAVKGTHPVEIQVMDKKMVVDVSVADEAHRGELWQQFLAIMGDYQVHQDKTERRIPVVLFRPKS